MQSTKFVVKVNRGGTRAPEYVRRIDRALIQMTTNRKLALVMGKLTAEDAVEFHSEFPLQPGASVRPG